MCLISPHYLPIQAAKEDLVVYKILKKRYGGELYGPFCGNVPYKLNVESTSLLESMMPCTETGEPLLDIEFVSNIYAHKVNYYRSGIGIYSFSTLKLAEDMVFGRQLWSRTYGIYECVIPKGSKLITDGDMIISNKLIPKMETKSILNY